MKELKKYLYMIKRIEREGERKIEYRKRGRKKD